ncbi:MAG: bifunctional DNA-formamidopyrimidine glycosylase/DNA-(apurinic or apyrimidinic site) lyase [Actinomycetia bacterium]|nr:bifunctional DNA-formamidopyrimidine glycosylase/DNA-(apurinic or apyrimidinic site) lyase [Actinomycetes bacterium]
METIRAGLARHVVGRTIAEVSVRHPRAVRRHLAGPEDLIGRLTGQRITGACRRGKYLWLPLADPGRSAGPGRTDDPNPTDDAHPADDPHRAAKADGVPGGEALLAHLGMSGQLRVAPDGAAEPAHLHVRVRFADGGPQLRFVDPRTFGGLVVDELVPTADAPDELAPALVAHIARDPFDPRFDAAAFSARLRRRRTALKRALLDQTLISGVGNIYADESLWRARLRGDRPADTLTAAAVGRLVAHIRAVLSEAIAAGGTSFDAAYVDVDGAAGYFERALAVYGRAGEPCPRCGAAVRREAFMNRSSYFCPRCQRPARVGLPLRPAGVVLSAGPVAVG